MSQVIDSYTGEQYIEDYVSPFPTIKRGRESFFRRAEMERAAQQYWVSPHFPPEEEVTPEIKAWTKQDEILQRGAEIHEEAALALAQEPGALPCPATPYSTPDSHLRSRVPSGWLLRRKDSSSDLFPLFPSQASAVAVMDWCVRNDASVKIVLHWLERSNPTPFLCMMQDITKIAINALNKDS